MSNEWAEMLKNFGIEPNANEMPIVEEPVDGTNTAPQLLDLSDWVVVDVTGADAGSFLQGQFCNDLQQVSVTRAQITGYCTPKGRLLALPTIVGTENGFRLLIKSVVKDAFIKRLSMFIMRSDVTLHDREDLACSGVLADSSGSVGELEGALGALPVAPLDVATMQDTQLIRWHDDHIQQTRARYVFISEKTTSIELWKNYSEIQKRAHARWRAGDISAGIPSISDATNEAFVPQMINLQLIDALSFTKGCYPGQEIVARMQYLGKLKRHMRLFKMPSNEANVVPASKIASGEDEDAGLVIDAVSIAETNANEVDASYTWLLAVVKVSADAQSMSCEGQELQALNLPYGLPTLDVGTSDPA